MVRNINYSFNSQIPNGGIASEKIADGAITSAKLGNDVDFAVSAGTRKSMTAGEDLATNVPIRAERGTTTHFNGSSYTGGDTSLQGDGGFSERIAQKFTLASAGAISEVIVSLKKENSPTDNVSVEIVADNNNEASGASQGTSSTVAGSSITTSFTNITFSFSSPLILSAGTYWAVVKRSGANHTSVRYVVQKESSATGGSNTSGVRNNSSWSNSTSYYNITLKDVDGTAGELVKAKADSTGNAKCIGFTTAAITNSNAGKIQNTGILDGFTSLERGEVYYLQNDGTLAKTAGTVSKKVGRAISDTELSIDIEE